MLRLPHRSPSLLLAVALVAAGAASAFAREPGVCDEAKLFTPEAVARANDKIRQIKGKFQQDVFIDTVAELPAAQRDKLKGLSRKAQDQLIAQWAAERAAAAGPASVSVVIYKEPRQVHVIVGEDTQQRAFTASDGNALRQLLVKSLGQGLTRRADPSRGLLDGVAYIHDEMDSNLDESVNWKLIVGAVALILGLWLVIGVARWRGAKPAGEQGSGSAAATPADAPSAGLFGGGAGGWVFRSLFGGSSGQAAAAPEPPPTHAEAGDPPAEPEAADVAGHDPYPEGERRRDEQEYF
jgi:hypothetical protein